MFVLFDMTSSKVVYTTAGASPETMGDMVRCFKNLDSALEKAEDVADSQGKRMSVWKRESRGNGNLYTKIDEFDGREPCESGS